MAAKPDTLDHTTLTRLVEAGAVRGAHVLGQKGGWAVVVKYGMHERPLAATRSRRVRIFRRLDTVVGYLRDVGLARFDVDSANYDPNDLTTARRRPDRVEAAQRARDAIAHDDWFRDQVQQSITEADDPGTQWLSQADVRRQSAAKRAEWRERVAPQQAKGA